MPTVTLDLFKSPGTYVTDALNSQQGVNLTVPTACYMLGTVGTNGTDITNKNVAVAVSSEADFIAKFGADSPSLKSVSLYFANYRSGLYFIGVTAAVSSATAVEIKAAMDTAIDEYSTMGVIIAPQFFAETGRTDYTTVAADMANLARDRKMIAFLDAPYAARATIGTDDTTANSVRKFATDIGGARSHAALFYPYLLSAETTPVAIPPSPAVAAIALKVWGKANLGIRKPPAGVDFPIAGISGTNIKLGQAERDILNPKSVNAISYFRQSGYCVYGSRTLNNSLTFINSQVILNVLHVSLRQALEPIVFETIDSNGELFIKAGEIAEAVMYLLWSTGALTGATPSDAYRVICDSSNNNANNLKNGVLVIDIYLSPAGTAETVVIIPHRVEIGGIPAALEANRIEQ